MKHSGTILFLAMLLLGNLTVSLAQTDKPSLLYVKVNDFYKVRPDGKAGRSAVLTFSGNVPLAGASIEAVSRLGRETYSLISDSSQMEVLLNPQIGVERTDTVYFSLVTDSGSISAEAVVPKMRHWTVYIYPHSHVDIGYTNTQDNVEFIHKRNLDVAMDLAEKTRSYPADAQFRWNPEVVWPVERYLASEPEDKCQKLIEAIKRGDISVDAGYVNTNTSACSDEELLQLFSFGDEIEELTGKPIQTMVQTDIPGMSWGVVTAANRMGVKYVLSLFNGSDRTGLTYQFSFKPFWWEGPDGKSRVLFLQPGSYTPGANAKGWMFWPKLAGQTDRSKLIPIVKTDNPRANFIDSYLAEMLPKLEDDKDYPFDIFPMTWCMADNTPIDVDLPDAVKSWNEEYAYPHLKICTATEMVKAFEDGWGDQLPVLKGDFTEYWTDGLGSAAAKTGESREVKEKLVQSEVLWSMLRPGEEEPQDIVREAWRNMILSTEHTWAFMDPNRQPIQNDILGVKFGYFDKAKELTDKLMNMSVSEIESTESDWITVFNTDSWTKTSLVKIPSDIADGYNKVFDANGKELASQKLTTGELAFIAEDVPALGSRSYHLEKGTSTAVTKPSSYLLDNGLVKVKIDPLTGDVCSIIYNGEEFVDQSGLANADSYRYLHGNDSPGRASRPSNVRISAGESGPLVNSIIIESDAEGCNGLRREVRIIKGSPAVEFDNVVDKKDITSKEGVHFGFSFNVPSSVIRANVPWGAMEIEKDQLQAANRNWIAVERWLDVSNENKGVTWCTLNACAFEVGDLTANIIGSAIKSPEWITKVKPSSTIYSWALNNHWHTNFPLSQSGKITFKYRLLPHDNAFREVDATHFAFEQYRPMVVVRTEKDFALKNQLAIDGGKNVILSNYKTIGKGRTSILRFLSLSSEDQEISVSWTGRQPRNVEFNGTKLKKSSKKYSFTVPAKGMAELTVSWK
jgi:alpha-mannosidase